MHDGRLRMTHAGSVAKEGLGRAEVEVHVQPHGKMVRIVGDVEAHNLLFFIVFALDERKTPNSGK